MLEIKGLCVSRGGRLILDEVNMCLTPHTLTVLVGKNGCGKSTLVSCINQTVTYRGEISFSGRNLALMPPKERACVISFLPQILRTPHITVEELVSMGRSPYIDIGHHMTKRDREAVERAICNAEIENLAERYVDALSGGERQKAYLAMAIAQDTRIMILDEPTTYMDMTYEYTFMKLLGTMCRKYKKTLLVVMHNLNQAVRYADRLAVLEDRRIMFEGSTDECVKSGVLERVFSVHRYDTEGRYFFAAE